MSDILDRVLGRGQRLGEPGRRAEARATRRNRGRAVPGSGSGKRKGDYEVGQFLVEHKSTTAGSLRLLYAHLAKIAQEARGVAMEPALGITFNHESGEPVADGAWVMVPERTWRRLTDGG